MISARKQQELLELYEGGERVTRAAAIAGVHYETARGYFDLFAAGRQPRRRVLPTRTRNHRGFRDMPAYLGPVWIGKPAN